MDYARPGPSVQAWPLIGALTLDRDTFSFQSGGNVEGLHGGFSLRLLGF